MASVCDLVLSSILASGMHQRHICESIPVALLLQVLSCTPYTLFIHSWTPTYSWWEQQLSKFMITEASMPCAGSMLALLTHRYLTQLKSSQNISKQRLFLDLVDSILYAFMFAIDRFDWFLCLHRTHESLKQCRGSLAHWSSAWW